MKIEPSYRCCSYLDLVLGVFPLANTVKSLALLQLKKIYDLYPEKGSNEWCLFLKLKASTTILVEAAPLLGNIYSLFSLVIRGVSEQCFHEDFVSQDFHLYQRTHQHGLDKVAYLYLERASSMSEQDKEYCLRLGLRHYDREFLLRMKEKMQGRIDKTSLLVQVLNVAGGLDLNEMGAFSRFLEEVREIFEEELKGNMTHYSQQVIALHESAADVFPSLLPEEEVSCLKVMAEEYENEGGESLEYHRSIRMSPTATKEVGACYDMNALNEDEEHRKNNQRTLATSMRQFPFWIPS